MDYEKVKEQIRETLDEARDYVYANSKANDYYAHISGRWYFYVRVGVDFKGDRYIIATIDLDGFEPLCMTIDPFTLKGEHLEMIITSFAECIKQIEKEK